MWPGDTDPRRVAVAGLVLNEHPRAHGCLHVARRLRDIKNVSDLSHAEVAEQTGLPLDRVKTYFSLFGASDDMLRFLDEKEVPLKVAAEFVRFEKATNEARAPAPREAPRIAADRAGDRHAAKAGALGRVASSVSRSSLPPRARDTALATQPI